MRVALDARNIYRPNRRGTGKNLIDLYRTMAELRPSWTFLMFYQSDGFDDPFADVPNVRREEIDIRGDRLNLWEQVRLPLAAKKAAVDALHCPANTAPRYPLVPMVVTIHDLHCLDKRLATDASRRRARNVTAAARKAKKVLTPSRYTKAQIVKSLGVPTDNIIVNPWAADRNCAKVTDKTLLSRTRRRYGLPPDRPYVFGFGSADPRKNTMRILQAWSQLPAELRDEYVLLLVGMEGPAGARVRAEAQRLKLQASCFLHAFAAEEDMAALISGATVMCYPSLSEGFGLPILDAFACETAVVTSTTTSLPEVAGDAALLVDPESEESIAAALTRLLREESLRSDLVARGRVRVKPFTWQACAERACRVFEAVVGETN